MDDDEEETFDAPGAECEKETGIAIYVRAPDLGLNPVWIPKSMVHDDSEVYATGHTGTLIVHYWFAEQRGWV